MDKLQRGMSVLLANSYNFSFIYGTFLRKMDWDQRDQGLQIVPHYAHNLLGMRVDFRAHKVLTSSFDRYAIEGSHGFVISHQHRQLIHDALELSKVIRILSLRNDVLQVSKHELVLFNLLEQIPVHHLK